MAFINVSLLVCKKGVCASVCVCVCVREGEGGEEDKVEGGGIGVRILICSLYGKGLWQEKSTLPLLRCRNLIWLGLLCVRW